MRIITALLGEITEIISGTTPESTTSKYWSGQNVWITPTDLGKNQALYLFSSERKITEEGLKLQSKKIAERGSCNVFACANRSLGNSGMCTLHEPGM